MDRHSHLMDKSKAAFDVDGLTVNFSQNLNLVVEDDRVIEFRETDEDMTSSLIIFSLIFQYVNLTEHNKHNKLSKNKPPFIIRSSNFNVYSLSNYIIR